ncbi:MAG: TetR/AcrR family transcriptional regulator [Nevskia sp.]|nr:TetR/AcrR family transcriptional regulator [Nevskia sp.]
MFLAKGYDGVSVDAIVARAGGTKTNVYKHFGGKAELFAAVVEELCRQIVHSFAEMDLDGMDPEEALRQIGRRFLTALFTQRSVRQHRIVVAESVRFPAVGKRWFKAGPESARDPIAGYFQQLQKSSRMRNGVAPRRLAGLFLDMLSEEQLLRQLIAGAPPPSTREINKLVDDAVAVFLHGALAPKRK